MSPLPIAMYANGNASYTACGIHIGMPPTSLVRPMANICAL